MIRVLTALLALAVFSGVFFSLKHFGRTFTKDLEVFVEENKTGEYLGDKV